jgi:hypothetical protein
MAIDWRLVTSLWWKVGESYPRFLSDFGGHGPTVCFWFWSTRGLEFGRPASAEDSSLEVPWSYADAGVCSRAKTGLVWRDFLNFGFRSPIYRAPGWPVFIRYIVCVDVGIGWTGAEAVCFRILVCLICVVSSCIFLFVRALRWIADYCNVYLQILSTGSVLVCLLRCFFCSLVFLLYIVFYHHYIFTALTIYIFCNNLYLHCYPQEPTVWRLAAQTADGDLRVRAPGFRSSSLPIIGCDREGSTYIFIPLIQSLYQLCMDMEYVNKNQTTQGTEKNTFKR